MREISDSFTTILPGTEEENGKKMSMPSFFERPSLWFLIKMKIKSLFKK